MTEKFRIAGLGARLTTGILFAAVLIAVWVMSGWYVAALVSILALAGVNEFISMFLPRGAWAAKCTAFFLTASYLAASIFIPDAQPHISVTACSIILALYALFGWARKKTTLPLIRAALLMCGILYIPVLLSPLMHYSRWEQLLIVLIPAASDIAAYFAGVHMGKHRIWPSVSPQKSIEGSLAGLFAAVTASVALGLSVGKAPADHFVLLGVAMGVMAQLGDFFESALKRAANVKDSGRLLPGHGGVLDRLDSILFCAAAYTTASAFHPFF